MIIRMWWRAVVAIKRMCDAIQYDAWRRRDKRLVRRDILNSLRYKHTTVYSVSRGKRAFQYAETICRELGLIYRIKEEGCYVKFIIDYNENKKWQ
jgi:membrane-bound lytic murein transglycosylase MltF